MARQAAGNPWGAAVRGGAGGDPRAAGFTLVELAVVVMVIGILASFALTSYNRMTDRARTASCISNQRNLVPQAHLYAVDHNLVDGALNCLELFQNGYIPAGLAECPSSAQEDWDDYDLTLVGGQVTATVCQVRGNDHLWQP